MKLKTYTASTMAQALAQVRKDLGPDAQIVHTRTYKAGSWFGIGGRAVVEITASSPAPAPKRPTPQPRRQRPLPPKPTRQPELEPKPAPKQAPAAREPIEHAPEITVPRRTRVSATTKPDDRAALFSDEVSSPRPIRFSARPAAHEAIDISPVHSPEPVEPEAPKQEEPERDPIDGTQFASSWIETSDRSTPEIQDEIDSDSAPIDAFSIEDADEDTSEDIIESAAPEPVFDAPEPELHDEQDEQSADELRDKLASLERMMSSVLESTRRTDFTLARAAGRDPSNATTLGGPLGALHAQLVENEVPIDLADSFANEVRATLEHDELADARAVQHALLGAIERSISTIGSLAAQDDEPTHQPGTPRVVALIGPTGVGKTTSVAKIAAGAKLRAGKRVGLVTSDTYRIGAVEQLKTYADIIDLQLRVANNPDEMRTSIDALQNCDLVVVDTAGRSQHNSDKLSELRDLLESARPDEIHLVLSTTVSPKVLQSTADKFKDLDPDRCVLTKLDECVSTGLLARIDELVGLPISFVTTGQEVPDDLRPARAPRLARAVLEGPGAIIGTNTPRATYDPPNHKGLGEES